jgi:hypothetical protein
MLVGVAWSDFITALIGLAGVLVGGAITWAREAWVARSKEEADVVTAARLLSDELVLIALQLELILDEYAKFRLDDFERQTRRTAGKEPLEFREPQHIWAKVTKFVEEAPTNLWLEHQAPLARELSDDDWRSVRRVYTLISIFRVYPRNQKPVSDVARQQAMLIKLTKQIQTALAALDKYTGEPDSHVELMKLMKELDLHVDDLATHDEGVTGE